MMMMMLLLLITANYNPFRAMLFSIGFAIYTKTRISQARVQSTGIYDRVDRQVGIHLRLHIGVPLYGRGKRLHIPTDLHHRDGIAHSNTRGQLSTWSFIICTAASSRAWPVKRKRKRI